MVVSRSIWRVAFRCAGREWEHRAVSTAVDGCRSIDDEVIVLYLEVVMSRNARIGCHVPGHCVG